MASLLQRSLRPPLVHRCSTAQLAGGCHLTPPLSSLHLTFVRCFRRDQGRIEVILNEDIRGLGYKNDIVQVRRGFARNILVPRNRAAYATNDNRRARNLPPLQLQRPPATHTDPTTATATTTSTQPATAAANHSRRYLQELTAHVSRLPIVFYKEAAAATGRFQGRPIDTLAIYRRLLTQHKTYFLHYSDLALPTHSNQPITALGSHQLEVRVRAVEEGGSGEREEVVRVEVRVLRGNEADEVAKQRRAEEAEEALEAARDRGEVDEDADAQAGAQKSNAKGRERAGVSKMRA